MKNILQWILRIAIGFSTPYFALIGAAKAIPDSLFDYIGSSLTELLGIVYFVLVLCISLLGFDKLIDSWSKKK